jgi:hypothetical protein
LCDINSSWRCIQRFVHCNCLKNCALNAKSMGMSDQSILFGSLKIIKEMVVCIVLGGGGGGGVGEEEYTINSLS